MSQTILPSTNPDALEACFLKPGETIHIGFPSIKGVQHILIASSEILAWTPAPDLTVPDCLIEEVPSENVGILAHGSLSNLDNSIVVENNNRTLQLPLSSTPAALPQVNSLHSKPIPSLELFGLLAGRTELIVIQIEGIFSANDSRLAILSSQNPSPTHAQLSSPTMLVPFDLLEKAYALAHPTHYGFHEAGLVLFGVEWTLLCRAAPQDEAHHPAGFLEQMPHELHAITILNDLSTPITGLDAVQPHDLCQIQIDQSLLISSVNLSRPITLPLAQPASSTIRLKLHAWDFLHALSMLHQPQLYPPSGIFSPLALQANGTWLWFLPRDA